MIATQVVTIVDTTKPDITAPENITKEATGPTTPVTVGLATATDLVTDPVIITRSPEGNEFAVGTHTITWKADDDNGNIITAAQTITITDTTKPVIALLGADPQTVEFGSIYNDPGATATDAVDDNDELTTQIAAASTVNTGTVGDYTVTYTVSDKATNAATPVIRMVTVTDTAAPTITAPADITLEATDTLTPLGRTHYGTATSTDDTADITDDAPPVFPLGDTTITWTATDKSTNEMMATQVVTVVDTTKPDITAPENITKEATGPTTPVTVGLATATDLVTDPVIITRSPEGNEFAVGTHTITWKADDDNGNIITAEQTITITDTTNPSIALLGDNPQTVEFGSVYTDPGATATDLVDDDLKLTEKIDAASTVDTGTVGDYTVTYTVSDNATNAATPVLRTVTVEDTAAPDITAPDTYTTEATATLTPLDRSDYGIATSTDDTADITDDAPPVFPLGPTTITWTATDKSTNEMMDTQVVTVVDTTKPDIAAPENITKEATGPTTPVTVGQATATDLVTASVTITRTPEADAFAVGVHKIIWTADDDNGNIITAEQTITITDTTKPVITLTNDNADSNTVELGSAYTEHGATATDAVDDNTELTRRIAINAGAVDVNQLGTYPVTYDVSDTEGNPAERVTRTVMVTDTTEPDITAPADITFEATDTLTPLDRSDYGIATSTDGNADITDDAPDAFPLGDTTITWMATDKSTNEMMDTQVVTIVDTTKPDIAAPENITKEATGPTTPVTVGWAIATDLVTDPVRITRSPEGNEFAVGTHTITWKADDDNGNIITAEQTITITDTTKPVIALLGDNPQTVEFGSIYNDPGATATDAVDDNDELTTQIAAASTVNTGTVGDYTVTYTVSDTATNAATPVIRMVMVTDTAAPDISPPANMTFEATDTLTPLGRTHYGTATSTDREAMITDDAPLAFSVGVHTITWRATDTNTLFSTAAQTITITDTTAPDITAPRNIIKEATAPTTPVTVGLAIATDLVTDPVIITRSPTDDAFAVGTHTITWKADDGNGNIITADQTITITDTTPPVIALLGDNPQTVEFGSIYNDPGATATDAVDDNDELTTQIAAISTVNTGTVGDYTITYTVSDTATNAATPVLRIVTVTDTAAPDITAPAAYTTEATATLTPLGRTHYGTATSTDREAMITDDAPPVFPLGDTTIIWTATDKSTNEMMDTQVVTVVDTTKPDIAAPENITKEATGPTTPVTVGQATATDLVTASVIITRSPEGNEFAVGVHKIIWTADDDNGNIITAEQTITITDTTKPSIALLGDNPQTVEFGSTYTDPGATATDLVDDDLKLTEKIDAASTVDTGTVGDYTVTYTVSDNATNAATPVLRTVTVEDTAAPDIIAPNTYTTEATATLTPLDRADYGIATSTDGNADITDDAPDAFPLGDTTITWTATDKSTNEMMDTQVVTVVDTTKPDIAAPRNITKEATGPTTPVTVGWAIATDLVTDPVIITRTPEGNEFAVGTHTITWKADDGNGNIITAAQTITITDTTKPVIALLGDNPQTVEFGSVYTDPGATATDAVDDNDELTTQIAAISTVDTGTVGDYTITYTVSDKATNAATPVIRTVTVEDTAAPDIIAPNTYTTEATATLTPLDRSDYGIATSTDDTADITDDAPPVFPLGPTTITWTATDKSTNEMMATQVVTIVDTTPPVIVLLGADPQTIEFGTTYTELNATATDEVDDDDELTRRIVIDANAVDTGTVGDYTVTYTVSDTATNAATPVIRIVTVEDTAAPDITAPAAYTTEATATLTPLGRTHYGTATSTDRDAMITDDAPLVFPLGPTTITWTATDKSTNEMMDTQVVTIVDTTKPDITAPANITEEATGPTTSVTVGQATATDLVTDPVRITRSPEGNEFAVGTHTITWKADDGNGNISTAEQTITITDTTKPSIALLGDNPQTVEFGSIYNDPGATATDAVDDNDELTTQIAAASTVDTGTVGDYTVTYTVSDTATNAATPVLRIVTVTDTAAPDITAPAAYTTEATATLTPLGRTHYGTATSTDREAMITDDAPLAFPLGPTTITWTATDKSTNEMMDTQVVTVVDTTKPDIAAPRNITKEATGPTTPVTVGLAIATDLVTASVTITRDLVSNEFAVGTHTITWKADDGNGNIITATQTITITDTTKPVIVLLGDNPQTVEFGSVYTDPGATATDAVDDNDELTTQIAAASTVNTGTVGDYTVTYTVSDNATNAATPVIRMVIVTDTVIPDISPPADITFEATDTLTPLGRTHYGIATSTDGTADITDDAPDVFPLGATTITWTATDKSTNEMMDTQVVTVVDTTKPDIAAPRNITKEATAPTTPVTVGQATATDLVTASVAITRSPTDDAFAVGVHKIIWTADDDNGNIITAEQTITITDTTPPDIALLGDNPQTVEFGSIYNDPGATATDAVDDDDELTIRIAAVSTVDTGTVGDYTVTYTVSDKATNVATPVIRMVTVTDTAAPDISPPADITFEATDTLTPLDRSDYGIATSGDDTADITDDAPEMFSVGVHTITWTATDTNALKSTAEQTITITDTTAPDITAPENITKEATAPITPVTVGQATATDLVTASVTITRSPTDDAFAVGTHTITWKADDGNGNIITAAQTITITDTTKPVIALLGDNPQTVEFGSIYNDPGATATDAVDDNDELTIRIAAVSTVDTGTVGDYTVTYTVSDKATNAATPVIRMVTVTDTTEPDITAPADITFEATDTLTPLGRTHYGTATSSDREAMITDDAPLAFSVGVHTITWRATDTNTLFSTAAQTITITDTTAPDIAAPRNITKEATAPTTPVTVGLATATDLVTASVTITRTPEGNEFAVGTHTITWKADDGNGNIITAEQTVTITDTTKPVIALLGDNPQTVEFGSIYNDPGATATDAVDDNDELTIRIAAVSTVDTGTVGDYTVTYTVSDKATNVATPVTRMVTVTDTEAPDISPPDTYTTEATATLTPLDRTDYGIATSTDGNADITDDAPDAFPLGATTITWTATDPATNEMMATQVVTIVDTTAPVIALLGDNPQTVEFGSIYNDPGATATDAVDDNDVLTTQIAAVSTVDTGAVGDYTVIYTVSDTATNAATPVLRMVTVTDTAAPDISPPADITFEATDTLTPLGRTHYGTATSTDREAMITDDAPLAFPLGPTTITWTATDKSTNEMIARQVVTIVDTTKPDIAAPRNITKEATGPTTPVTVGLATATDLVTDPVIITRSPEGNEFAVGTHTITWKADDGNGNIITAAQTITITDTTKPVIVLLGDNPQTVEFGSIYNDPGATATDAVDDDDELTIRIAAVSTVDTGTVGDYTVTYTVSDTATNAATPVLRMVTVTDTEAPDITAPAAYTTEATATLTPLGRTHYGIATSSDREAMITDDAPLAFPLGETTITWTATDTNTLFSTAAQTITITDTTKPDITAPENIIKEATGPTTPVTVGQATATDLVTDPVIITRSPEGNEFAVGTHTITWKADDGNGNIITAAQTITITDTTKPVIVLLGDNPQTVEFGSVYTDPGATATDAVDDNDELMTQIAAASTVDTDTVGNYTITYTVSDKATNAATPVIRMVTVTDTEAPDIIAPAAYTTEATATLTPLGRTDYGTATSTDREAMITDDAPDAFPLGDTTITWTATDKSNNEDRATQVVTVVDTTKPDIAAPENITKEATGPTTPVTVGQATATDLVTASVTITRSPTDDAFAVGVHKIIWTADDDNGNIITAEQTITITDTTKPSIALLGDNPQTVEFGSTYTDPDATATDLVDDDIKLTEKIHAVSTVDTGTVGDYTVTYTVSDTATNAATPVVRMVMVTDTTEPDITAPLAMTFEATDTLTLLGRTHYGTATSGDDTADITDDAPDAFPLGATTITWTATDPATNEMIATQVVTVVDTTKPDITAPENIIKEATGPTTPVTVGLATATDLVTDPVIITRTPEADAFAVGTHTITWKADDGNGNIITAAQTIAITDTTKPVIVLLGDNPQTVEFGSIYNDPGATATDAVDDNDELTIRIAAASTVNTGTVGNYTVTYTVSDTATNAATPVLRMVTVTDTAAPDISPPADITFEATDTLTPLGRTHYGTATSTDREAMITDDAPLAFSVGVHTITWTATDTNTLFSTAAQTITITDTTAPDIAAPRNITKEATGPTTPVTVGWATATDLVTDPVTITRTPTGNDFTVGTHTITWKADDDNGNIITAAQTITITDTTKPVIALLGDNPQTVEFGSIYNDPGATATDAVDDNDELTTQIAAASTVDTGTVGDYTITYTVSDKATNAATPVIRMVMVTDTTEPDITAPADITFEATDTLTPLDRSDYGIATSTDGNADITDDAPDAFPLGPTTITWTATDKSTNEMMDTQVVTVVDTTKPVIALNGLPEVRVEFGGSYTELQATATDAVDDDIQLTDKIVIAGTVDTNLAGIYHITYDVTDAAGNDAITVTRTVTLGAAQIVIDKVPPTIIAPSDVVVEATSPRTTVRVGQATATDNMDPMPAITRTPTGNEFVVGKHTITWTATDASDNSNSVEQTITITDTTKPSIALLGDNPQTVEFGSVYNDPGATATDAVDDNDELTTQIAAASTVDTGTVGDYTVTYTVSDKATNAATPVIRMVTVEDTAAPDITAPANITFEATDTLTPLGRTHYGTATSSDREAMITDDAPLAFSVGVHTITWTATDTNTLFSTAAQTITITDTTAPDIAAPRNITKEATAPTTPVTVGLATATDLVTDPVIITRTPEGNEFAVGTHTITWKADDGNGNIITAAQTITITDTTKPVIALLGDNPQTVEFGSIYNDPGATATDAVDDNDELTTQIAAASTVDTGTVGDYTVTYTVSDTATNAATPVIRMVMVTDTVAPDISPPADITFEATDTLTPLGRTHYGTATSTDGNADITDDAPLAFSVGVHTITWTATDTNSLFSTAAQTITITDTTKPDITAPENITKEATGPTTPVTVGQATATDLVTDPVIITRTPEGNEFAVGTHTITWKADDGNGNIITAAQTITITDTTPPDIALLGDNPQTVEFGSIYNDPGATATDAVDDDDELTIRIAAVSTVDTGTVGDYTITYTVSDTATNAATPVIRMVTVTDTEAPDITAPAAYTTEATATLTPLGRTHYGIATSGDDTADITDDAPDAFPLGATTITWTATDPATNEMMDTQVVTVVDTTKPVIALLGADPQTVEFGSIYNDPGATATDAVDDDDELTIRIAAASTVNTGTVGDYTVTYTVSDTATNAATPVIRMVTVTDTEAPDISPPADITLEATDTLTPLGRTHYGTATSTDREAMITDDAPLAFPLGDTPITWTATDTNTLFSTAAQTITITDTTAPDITAPENITKEATGPTTPVTVGLATATDLVTDPVIITRSPTADAFAVGTHTITWKADDGNGNIITAEQTITITDTTKPVITLTNDNADSNTVELGSAYTEHGATATDAVDDNTELTRKIAINAGAVDVNRLGTYPVTYDVSDTEGNPAERVTRMVMVTDTTEPDITAPANMTFEATDTLTPLGRTHYGTATSTDREAMITDDAPDAFPLGDTTITWTATDPATNEMIATQVVTVVDTTKPVIALNGLPEVRVEFGGSYTELQATATDAVDDDIQLTDKIVIAGTVDTNLAGIYHITYDVTDAAGNDAITVIRTVTLGAAQIVIDKVPPTIIAPSDVVVEATSPRTTVRVGQATATDNMDPMPAITRTPTGNEFVVGKHTITWTATDASDNSNSAEQTITITDTTKPSITLTDDTADSNTVEFGSTYNDPGATATDLVDNDVELTEKIVAVSTVDTGTVGDYTITYTVSDKATNAATPVLRTVTVNPAPASTDANLSSLTLSAGTLSPTFAAGTISYAVNVVVNDVASTTVTPTTADAGATVTVAGETVTSGEASAAIDLTVGENAIAIVVTAEDGTAMKTYTVSVTRADNTAPSIQGRAAVNYAENEPITTIVTTYTATDAESNAITWSLGGTDADQLSIGATSGVLTFNAPPNFEDAQDTDTNNKYQVTVTATDNGEPNMSSTLNVTVTVTNVDEDGAIGVISGTAQVGEQLTAGIVTDPDGGVTGTTYKWQSADDDSDIDSATESTYTLAVADFGKPIQVVATYNDGHGDDKQVTSAPTDTVVAADAPDAPSIALAVDTGVDPSDGITSNGQVNVTGVVTDATWKHTIKGTVTEVADPSVTFFTLDEGEYTATEVQVVQTLLGTDSAAANLGAVTVDRTPPVISLNGAATITLIVGDTTYTEQATVTDNLDASITLDISGETVDTQAAGTYTLTYDATDAAGNEAMQVTRMVMVTDTTKPDITAPADMTFEARSVLTPLSRSDYGIATSTDDTADITDDAPPAFPLGDTTITWTATDKSTNEMIARQVVTVVDTTKPSITAPGNITKEATGYTTLVTPGQATATDFVADMVAITRDLVGDEADLVVGSASVGDIQMGNEFAVGTHKIIWTADDGNGNISTAAQTITITDTTKPVIVLLGDNPQTVEFGSIYNDPGATATDLVDADNVLTTRITAISTVNTARLGTYPVTYDVSDTARNPAARVTRTVMVTDTAAPGITAPIAYTTEATATRTPLSRSHYGTATSSDGNAMITDNAPAAFPLGDDHHHLARDR